ncbi:MAG: proline/glycine betaine ABC transporter ATP-binding protein [Acidiferrobacteraceae bacterium]|jgi:glycine betaine/proline transport system ATP-binding protein|nr:proline/glycine betaine ABC transporter ATP-binding protein [Acidiferrobacteraceae bacterium]MDP6399347.1 glycine betaine/L-proline ABC transporter ATP-binding protein [Arenicellales bacterium]MDP6552613.1 glycine betaine/L-proline ABC transporter ATP-binding protein [Arenicellales bacterium]MDP6791815.1 glycine betaine/L-proline ABC transporter ATP-binding protein [Arenicellales bacterium]MDP6919776.1 glycine betaine/L-proline ABC transporter ATP-binding protein [Arenicellales bacterium]|tara:strand:+ start:12182 stop:13213 length:1032 start_codon:yes stop_codon:yes gene_type:complete
MSETPKIVCNNVWKIFGAYPEQTLKDLDRSLSRAEVQAQTGHVIAVKDVSFEVNTGETFVVMGLSGSGKSTLVRCISRLIEPTAGAMIIDGEDIMSYDLAKLTELRRFRMSMVFQHFGLFPHRKVIDNISFGLEIRGMDKEARKARSLEVLQKVGLDGWAEHFPRELSGGMQQRVGLARAMAVNPEILIFDEPFSALDPLIRREMQDELLSIQAEVHKTMIFITHDFLEAIKMGDRIAIMKDGVVVQIGTPEEIVTNPVDDYVREFTEDVPRYKVVSVGRVMQAVSDPTRIESAERIHHKAKIDSLIDTLTKSDGPLAVVDDENRIVGEVTQTMILKAMSSQS